MSEETVEEVPLHRKIHNAPLRLCRDMSGKVALSRDVVHAWEQDAESLGLRLEEEQRAVRAANRLIAEAADEAERLDATIQQQAAEIARLREDRVALTNLVFVLGGNPTGILNRSKILDLARARLANEEKTDAKKHR